MTCGQPARGDKRTWRQARRAAIRWSWCTVHGQVLCQDLAPEGGEPCSGAILLQVLACTAPRLRYLLNRLPLCGNLPVRRSRYTDKKREDSSCLKGGPAQSADRSCLQ